MQKAKLKELITEILRTYERTYLDALVLHALLKNRGVPHLEEAMKMFRNDPTLQTFVRGRFEPLHNAVQQADDSATLLQVLLNMPTKGPPN